jgi:hypothetical protein
MCAKELMRARIYKGQKEFRGAAYVFIILRIRVIIDPKFSNRCGPVHLTNIFNR